MEDTSTTGAKFSPLDGLRGIAVLIVFLSHSSGFRQRLTPWTSFHGTGHLGVYLFFVLSGFLLTCSLLTAPRVSFPGFYFRRFFRVAPLFYLVVTAVLVVQLLTGGLDLYNLHIKAGWLGYAQHLLFYRGDSVFWTIAAEFQFYLILPFLILVLRSRGVKAAYFFAVIAVAYGAWHVLIEMEKIDPIYTLKVAQIVHRSQYLDVFLYGILAAWIFRQPSFGKTIQQGSKTLRIFANAAAVALAFLSLFLVAENFFGFGRIWRNEQTWWQGTHWPVKFGPQSWSFIYGPAFALISLASLTGHALFRVGRESPRATHYRRYGVQLVSPALPHSPRGECTLRFRTDSGRRSRVELA